MMNSDADKYQQFDPVSRNTGVFIQRVSGDLDTS